MDLADRVDDLAASGLHHFTTDEAVRALGVSPIAVRAAIRRLRARGRLATPFRGFHLRLSPEYRVLGCLPADPFSSRWSWRTTGPGSAAAGSP